jgi:hypothetical protein
MEIIVDMAVSQPLFGGFEETTSSKNAPRLIEPIRDLGDIAVQAVTCHQ